MPRPDSHPTDRDRQVARELMQTCHTGSDDHTLRLERAETVAGFLGSTLVALRAPANPEDARAIARARAVYDAWGDEP